MAGHGTYDSYRHWKGWDASGFGVCGDSERVYFEAEVARCGITDLQGLRILEVGFGNGAFAAWAVGRRAIYKGIETIPELVTLGRERGFDVWGGDRRLTELVDREAVDLVIAFDVLEHLDLPALRAKLEEIHEVLVPDGCLIARVPSGDSPFSRSIQHGDLTHRSALGSSAVRQIGEWTHFAVEQARAPVLPLTGLGVHVFLRRFLVLVARAVAYPLIARLFMGGGSPVLSPNMVVVFRKRDTKH